MSKSPQILSLSFTGPSKLILYDRMNLTYTLFIGTMPRQARKIISAWHNRAITRQLMVRPQWA